MYSIDNEDANAYETEFESEVVLEDLLCSKVTKYYVRYVDVPEDREFKPGTSIEECVK